MFRIIFFVFALFIMVGCSGWYGAPPDKPLLGKRISILSLEKSLKPDPKLSVLNVSIPRPLKNQNWAQAGGIDAYMDRLFNSSTREKIRDEVRAGIGGVKPMWNTWIISDVDSDANKSLVGRSIANIAVERGVEPAEAALQLEYEERGEVSAVVHNRLERDVRFFLSHPLGMIGSDGNAISPTGKKSEEKLHPRFYGTYPRILGKYVREESLLSLETAVSKMTSLPAKRLPLKNRGILEEGLIADIAIFNPDTIIDKATFEDPHQLAIGMHYVLVAGNLVIDNGKHTGASPGKVLRRNK